VIRIRILAGVLVGSLVATASVPASTILGTPRDETLRGTPKEDKLYGKAGNDRLLGLRGDDVLLGGPGRDRLVGGAGADTLVCGRGRDSAWADARDKVAKDCEDVKGVKPPPAALGTYCGSTSQGMPLCFVVVQGRTTPERTVLRSDLAVQADCEPARQLERSFEVTTFYASVSSDRTFSARSFVSVVDSTLEGVFSASGTSATGSLTVQFTEQVEGVRYQCNSGVVSWSARTPPPAVAAQPGTFCGLSSQGFELCFDVAGVPKTVTNLRLFVRTECTPAASLGVASTIPTRYAIGESGRFAFRRRGFTATGGGSFTVEHVLDGAFDRVGGSATGTISAHLAYDAPDGTHYECDTGQLTWSTQRR
jgi:RTX calcium-binding nonapeptide repeat (4 copies)